MHEDGIDRLRAAHPGLFRSGELPYASHLPIGWFGLADSLCCEIEVALGDQVAGFRFVQVKEKLGLLRVYFKLYGDGASSDHVAERERFRSELCELIDAAIERSRVTCAECGNRGWLGRRPGHLATLCDAHACGQ